MGRVDETHALTAGKLSFWVRIVLTRRATSGCGLPSSGSPLIEDLRQDIAQDLRRVHISVQLKDMIQAGMMTGASRSLRHKRLVKVSANELQAQLNKAF